MLLGLTSVIWLGACAPDQPLQQAPRPDMAEVAKQLNCRVGRTPTCVERINKPYSCYCMDEDSLRMILEPGKY
jgi:hypothetical protein